MVILTTDDLRLTEIQTLRFDQIRSRFNLKRERTSLSSFSSEDTWEKKNTQIGTPHVKIKRKYIYIYIYIPGSSKCVKFVPFHPKNLPKGRNFTYLEDPGIYIYIYSYIQRLCSVAFFKKNEVLFKVTFKKRVN